MMTYQETLEYLFNIAPMFQQVGGKAYKEGLQNSLTLDEHFHHPHQKYRCIHVAGTNGKGSTSHTLASVLQEAGYKVGLYTSPHLLDFSERIRVNGQPIEQSYVIDFVEKEKEFFEPLYPSFFELTTAMAFKYFADEKVDIAVIEVGMGGRLDCTNIINPILSIITNISLDHTQFLGSTLEAIAKEKAGIIKRQIPTVIGETTPETKRVFEAKAKEVGTTLYWAEENHNPKIDEIEFELKGNYQKKNKRTIYTALEILSQSLNISDRNIRTGFARVTQNTGLVGRWQKLHDAPTVICDTGHNVGGIEYISQQLQEQTYKNLHIVIGMVNDKDISHVLQLLPKDAEYYFTQASVKRALPATELAEMAHSFGLKGNAYLTVKDAIADAIKKSLPEDFIFIGGSNFIVADCLSCSDAFDFH